MGELRIIGKASTVMIGDIVGGDVRITWQEDNTEEVAVAEKAFNEYLQRGWIAIGEAGDEKKQIFTFNPKLQKIVLAPIAMGG